MKNNLIIDQKYTTIMVLNIPDDYPLIVIQYKSGKDIFTKSFVVRDIKIPTLKNEETFNYECIVSFFEDINIHTKFIPSHLMDVTEDNDSIDKLISYLSVLLKINGKTNPDDKIDLKLYLLKKQNILLNLNKDKLEIGYKYKIDIDDFPVGDYKVIDIKNEQITVRQICDDIEHNETDTVIDLIDILYLDINFERID